MRRVETAGFGRPRRSAASTRGPRSRRGLTLIEVLVVVSILALLVVVMVLFLFGGDDRKCRLEAERLAVWLGSAQAEAKMRDATVRAAFDLGEQEVQREVGAVGAQLSAVSWEIDKRTKAFKVKKPVRQTILDTPLGERNEGVGWIVFNPRSTPGGVAVLQLKEAVYSVVVSPRGEEIKVERGRARLPQPASVPIRRRPFGAGPPELSDLVPGGEPIPSGGGGPPPTKKEPGGSGAKPPPTGEGEGEGDEPDPELDPEVEPELDPEVEPEVDPFADPIDEPEEEEPDAGVEEECDPQECLQTLGRYGRCNQEKQCVIEPANVKMRAQSIAITTPQEIAPFLNSALQERINFGFLNLIVTLGHGIGDVGPDRNRAAYVVQGQPAGSGGFPPAFEAKSDLPTYRATAIHQTCTPGYNYCSTMEEQTVTIYIRDADAVTGECQYLELGVVAKIKVNLKVGTTGSDSQGELVFEGGIEPAQARRLVIPDDGRNLEEFFEDLGKELDFDTKNSGVATAWSFQFRAGLHQVEMVPGYEANVGREPDNCGQ